MDQAAKYLDRVTGLPPAPIASTELLDLFDDPNPDVDMAMALLRRNPFVCAKILRRHRSAPAGDDQPAEASLGVVQRLGFDEVYRTVAFLVAASTFLSVNSTGGLDLNKLWTHSVISAVAAATIANRVNEAENDAFTAGLFHDIGKLLFAGVEGAKYTELVRLHGDCGRKLRRTEQMVFGVDHPTLGARLLSRWGLPENIVSTVQQHHTSASLDGASNQRLVVILKLANNLSHLMALENAQICDSTQCNPAGINLLGLTADDIPNLVEKTVDGTRRVQRFSKLSFDKPARMINTLKIPV